MNNPVCSVVIPVYNSEKSLEELCQRIQKVFGDRGETYEIILVDDGSRDRSWEVMKSLRKEDGNIKIIQLMRNFGQHNALMCGFHYVSGEHVITMDDDLQNPPEEIPKLMGKVKEGYDAVIGALEVKHDTIPKRIGSSLIRYLMARIFEAPREMKFSSFRAMTKGLANEIKGYRTPYPFLSGMILGITRNIANETVRHEKRAHGKSNYTLATLLHLAFNLVINYSSIPLRVITLMGIIVSAIAFVVGTYFILKKIFVGIPVAGWTSVIVLLSFLSGVVLAALSLIGEYLVRIVGEVSQRQQYVVREKQV